MSSSRILFFDGSHVAVLRWQAGNVLAEDRFEPTPVGLEGLGELLAKERNTPVMLLADIAEEGFQLESIPRLQGADRRALLTRRLGQYYYGTPFATAISLGRETTGRRDERVQFAALTRPEMLTPWLELLRQAEVPLRGIYSVPLVLAASKLGFATQDRFLLITLSQGGLRQTFVDKGQMHFSRLSPLSSPRIDAIGAVCGREATKTFQYLLGQRQISRGAHLPVYVLAHPDDHPGLRMQCPNTNDLEFEFVDLANFAKECGYKGELSKGSFADQVLAHCLCSKTPAEQFAPAAERKIYRLWQTRFALRAAALTVAVGGLLWAGKQALDIQSLETNTTTLRAKTVADQQRYQGILGSLPLVSVTPPNLRAILARYDELIAHSPDIRQPLAHVGTTLAEFPGIELNVLQWKLAASPDVDAKASNGSVGGNIGRSVTPQGNNTPSSTSTRPWTIVELHGTLPVSLIGDQRSQVETINQLAEKLRRDNVLVRVLSMPIDITSDKTLRSDERNDSPRDKALGFSLQVSVPTREPVSKEVAS